MKGYSKEKDGGKERNREKARAIDTKMHRYKETQIQTDTDKERRGDEKEEPRKWTRCRWAENILDQYGRLCRRTSRRTSVTVPPRLRERGERLGNQGRLPPSPCADVCVERIGNLSDVRFYQWSELNLVFRTKPDGSQAERIQSRRNNGFFMEVRRLLC